MLVCYDGCPRELSLISMDNV